jgi:hypothetical protein
MPPVSAWRTLADPSPAQWLRQTNPIDLAGIMALGRQEALKGFDLDASIP